MNTARSLTRLSILLLGANLIGVSLIALSQSSQLLPDTFDPSRPHETWWCCMNPPETANPWRWPLFITGSLILLLSAAWGSFYAHRGLRRMVAHTPPTQQSTHAARQRLLEWLLRALPLTLVILTIGGGILIGTPLVDAMQSVVFSFLAALLFYSSLWLGLVVGCLAVPLLLVVAVKRWRAGQLTTQHWSRCNAVVGTWLIAGTLLFLPMSWLLMEWIAPNLHITTTARGYYPLDLLLFNRLPGAVTLFIMPLLLLIYGLSLYIVARRLTRPTQSATPTAGDTPS
ncbi:MAG: hypothetical protein Q4B05_02660 [Candidatus Saccharibacteria bacterium]|nr:hypothetical protein [Candidatus Saccharibacteria bacterium]